MSVLVELEVLSGGEVVEVVVVVVVVVMAEVVAVSAALAMFVVCGRLGSKNCSRFVCAFVSASTRL